MISSRSRYRFLLPIMFTILALQSMHYSRQLTNQVSSANPSSTRRNRDVNDTSLNKSLVTRNSVRMKNLRSDFGKYLDLKAFYQPSSKKTMIWSCGDRVCSGWGDRVRGMMSVYILALLTQRRFMIHMEKPCHLSQVLQPNLVNWTFVQPTNLIGRQRRALVINSRAGDKILGNLSNQISNEDFVSLWEPYDDIWFITNAYYVRNALRNPRVNSSWLLKKLPRKFATQQHLFPLMFELLFKPTQIVIDTVDQILRQSFQQLICFHIRVGRNPTNPLDSPFPSRENLTRHMIDFYHERKELVESRQSMIFVTADSDEAVNEVLTRFPNRSMNIPGPIMHIEYVMRPKERRRNPEERCAGLVKVMADFFTLGECDVSIITKSGFSQWATRRRSQAHIAVFRFNDTQKTLDAVDLGYF